MVYSLSWLYLNLNVRGERDSKKGSEEANRRREPGTREKVSSRRINLECNTYVQESNASQLPV
jgi:hypothetical protein